MSKLLNTILITALFASVLAGCGGKLEENYVMTTVREASRGDLLSPGFKYGFDTPNIVAAHGNMALVREGNLIEFFTGVDIEKKLEQVKGRRFTVAARKLYSPRIHFTVDFLLAGGDTIMVGEPYEVVFPALLKSIEVENFKEVDLSSLGPSTLKLKPIFNTKFLLKSARVGWEEVEWMGETQMVFTLNLDNVRFIVDDPGDQMGLMLKALMNEHVYFDGGVSFGERPATSTRDYRTRTKIGGKVSIDFIQYGGQIAITPI
jgi:hypothetical protein